ncbi:hypothetical protein [Chryseobacterium sp. 5_R23647]|uniref:hypothetical protein n=1 Tax=Chryseobacterium sp. 5_R23647 TaxID=2258964 RepID=UPI000E22A8D0|nr:hypothetical protein [Chryseobacterium sp. 5_R23647]REC39775.1 hypothetical protein DRF69_21610 [Chryseobacterium sp. 5_R23647]
MNNKETVKIELSDNLISLWEDNDESKYSELERELHNSDELIMFLCRYQKDRWEAESIDHIEVEPTKLHISYTINFFSGCKDLDKDDDATISVDYKINTTAGEIEIIGDPIPEERSTFEEF